MRKLNFLFLTLILMTVGMGSLKAQDTITSLIISEIRFDKWHHPYIEVTNMSETDSVWLGAFVYALLRDQNYTFYQEGDEVKLVEGTELDANNCFFYPDSMLAPGESYMIMAVNDVQIGHQGDYGVLRIPYPVHSIDMVMRCDSFVHRPDWGGGDDRYKVYDYKPEWQMFGFDSVSTNPDMFFHRLEEGAALMWQSGDSITVMVDQWGADINWETGTMDNDYAGQVLTSTAGVNGAHDDHNMVRKFSIKEGSTNWTLAQGSDAASSEWMLIPHTGGKFAHGGSEEPGDYMAQETEGVHGDFHLDYSSTVYDFDETAGTITVPWGTEKDDSLRLGLTLGPGMAWDYLENGNLEDSLSLLCKDDDTLVLYSAGTELEMKKFVVQVQPPTSSDKTVSPKHDYRWPDPEDDEWVEGTVAYVAAWWPYYVTENDPVMDSIDQVDFATPIDSFFMFLEKPPNAEWKIVFASGKENNEISEGDILRVTAEDASTKDYYIKARGYVASEEFTLSSLTWPDRPDVFMEGWTGDTVPGFSSGKTAYELILPPSVTAVPALVAEPEDLNAVVSVQRASSLRGGIAERTTTFTITAESDTSSGEVTVLFTVFNPDPQLYIGDPIFSKFMIRDWWSGGGMEIVNPSDVVVDLSEYMITKANGTTLVDAVTLGWENDSSTWLNRYHRLVPGYKWADWTGWQIESGKLSLDAAVDPYVNPKKTFGLWKLNNHNDWRNYRDVLTPLVNYFICNDFPWDPGTYVNPWGEPIDGGGSVANPVHSNPGGQNYFLLKIMNDSITRGLKAADDPNDFKIVDCMGDPIDPWNIDGTDLTVSGESWNIYRKSRVFVGDTLLGAGNSNDPDSSDWYVIHQYKFSPQPPQGRGKVHLLMGSHNLDPITGHLSKVASVVYKVSAGFQGDQTIEGVSNGEHVSAFLVNLIKMDETQVLTVLGGGEKTGADPIVAGDTLKVTSSTGTSTLYIISTAAIDGDATLTALDDSVTVSTHSTLPIGEVGGFPFGASIRWVQDHVVKAPTAVLNIVDVAGNLIPLQKLNTDTVMVDLVATGDYYFEVVAMDNTTIMYHLVPTSAATDAYVLSDVYEVSEQPFKVIASVPVGTGAGTLLSGLLPAQGATMRLVNVTGQERVEGLINYGDQVIVTAEDGQTQAVYALQLTGQMLAYVTSTVYQVDQNGVAILNVDGETDVATFLGNLEPATGATMTVVDSDGNEKTTGTVDDTDKLVVVSGDEITEVSYTIGIKAVSTKDMLSKEMMVYPNPANDVLYIENIPLDTYVRISDITGRTSMLRKAADITSGLHLTDLSTGLYFLTVEKDGERLATVRFIKQK